MAKMIRYGRPTCNSDFAPFIQPHRIIINGSKPAKTIMRTDCNEIKPRLTIIVLLQTDAPPIMNLHLSPIHLSSFERARHAVPLHMPHAHATLPHCHIATLPHCHIATLPILFLVRARHAVPLHTPHAHATLPHCPSFSSYGHGMPCPYTCPMPMPHCLLRARHAVPLHMPIPIPPYGHGMPCPYICHIATLPILPLRAVIQ
jgi:hypothetical protein